MLQLEIPLTPEGWDEEKEEFVEAETQILQLEHSLVSLAKWESKWCKAFLSKGEKTPEETLDYVKCMTLTENVDPCVYDRLTNQHIKQINDYIAAPMTATYFSEDKRGGGGSREVVTAELVYYWLVALQIPFECQEWHLNRLLTLVKVCNIKNQPPKKMSKRDLTRRNASLNAARRQRYGTRG
jgi:hypothetical protein